MRTAPGQATAGPERGLAAIASRHPAVGLAVGVVRDGHISLFHGHGLADIVSGTPVTEDTVFRIGSLTKTFTAIAVLQLCEHHLVDLDAPAGGYLRAYRLIPAKPPASPLRVLAVGGFGPSLDPAQQVRCRDGLAQIRTIGTA